MEQPRPKYEDMTKAQKGRHLRRTLKATAGLIGGGGTLLLLNACGQKLNLDAGKTPGATPGVQSGNDGTFQPPGRLPADAPQPTEQRPTGPSIADLVYLNMKLKPDVTTSQDPTAQSGTALETSLEFNPLPVDQVPIFKVPFDNTTVSEVWDQDNPNRTGKTIIVEFKYSGKDYSLMITNIQPDKFNPKLTPGTTVAKGTEIGLMGREADQRVLVKDQPDRRVAILKLWEGKGRTDDNRIALNDLFPDLPGTRPTIPQPTPVPTAQAELPPPSDQPSVAEQPTQAAKNSNVETQNSPEGSGLPDRSPIQIDSNSKFYAIRDAKTKEFAFVIEVNGGQEPRSEAPIGGKIVEVWDQHSSGGIKRLHDIYGDTIIIEGTNGISCSLSGLDLSKQVIPITVGAEVRQHQGLTGIAINTTRYQDIQTAEGGTITLKGKPVVRQLCFKGPRIDANRIELPESAAKYAGQIGDDGSQAPQPDIFSSIWNSIFGK